MSRIRAKLCNLFYPDRAKERADYLYFDLVTGRIERQFQLLLLVRRELERRKKLIKFSPLERFREFLRNLCSSQCGKVTCASCNWKIRPSKSRDLRFCVQDKRQTTKICLSCSLDVNSNDNNNNNNDNNNDIDAVDGAVVVNNLDKFFDVGCF